MNTQAIRNLREQVEAGECRPYQIEELGYIALNRSDKISANGRAVPSEMARAYEGSLDAAKALHEALLPGWDWDLESYCGGCSALVYPEGYHDDHIPNTVELSEASPARAWLIAILKALEAEAGE